MDLLIILILLVVAAVVVYYALTLRKIVPPNSADVVVNAKGGRIYSGDETVTASGKAEPVYYQWPQWLPIMGVTVRRMPLNIIEIPIKNFETFAKGNPRFTVDVSVYCKIVNVNEAARRFPAADNRGGSITDAFRVGIQEIVIGAVRTATANYNIEDIISKREELSNVVKTELESDFLKWGCEITNVAFVSIRDPDDGSSTVVYDISNKKEAEINSISRVEVANQKRKASITESEALEASEKRKIEAKEQIEIRDQQKSMNVAEQKQLAVQKEMEVLQTQEIRTAEIQGDAKIKAAEREKQAMVELANGSRQKMVLEGEGQARNTELTGNAEAAVIKSKMVAKAEGMLKEAEAQQYQQEKAIEIMRLDVTKAGLLAYAEALKQADIKYIGSGAPEKFMDLFTPGGGLNIGAALQGFTESAPTGAISSVLDELKSLTGKTDIKKITADDVLKVFNSMSPEDQKAVVSKFVGGYMTGDLSS